MKNYSIIIPFYDKFDLVKKAVFSIPDRSDIQIILIYNGNDEFNKSLFSCKSKSEIIFLTSSPEKGAGHARNIGLSKADGKYVLFLDSDDYFTEDAFSAFDKYLSKGNDITFFKPTSIQLKSGLNSCRHVGYALMLDNYLTTGNEDRLRYRWEVPYCKMYRNDFIKKNNFAFDEIKVNNDAWFSLMAGHNASKLQADATVVYVITEGEKGQSLIKTVTPETVFIRYNVAIRINKFLKSIHKGKMRIRLLGFINTALKEFGIRQAVRFTIYAIKNRANIF